jgi:chromosome segregation ATPase
MNHNGLYNPVGGGGNHALQDYQMQLMLLEQQNKKRLLMAKIALEEQDTALRTITSLPDQLNIAHTSVKELLENLPAYFQNIEDFKCSIPRDIETLQGYEEKLDKKEAEIKALENRYNELIQMTPEAQQGELRQVRDKAMLTMQQDREKLRLNRDNTVEEVEGKNGRIEGLGVALGRSKELVPELIEDLIKLAPKLRDVRMVNSNDSIRTIGENYGGV